MKSMNFSGQGIWKLRFIDQQTSRKEQSVLVLCSFISEYQHLRSRDNLPTNKQTQNSPAYRFTLLEDPQSTTLSLVYSVCLCLNES